MAKNFEPADIVKGNGETILVIEDEEILAEITKITLELYGYTVLTAKDGVEGIELFIRNKNTIQAVICDLNMPLIDGNTTLQTILKTKPDIKILIVSGSIETEKIPHFSESVKYAYLQKPYRMETLIKTLQQLFERISVAMSMKT